VTTAKPGIVFPSARVLAVTRACLGIGSREEWDAVRDLRATLQEPGVRSAGLFSLLLKAAQDTPWRPPDAVMSVLRAGRAHEELRVEAIERVCADVLTGDPVVVLGGTALAYGAYDEPVLRHCHDLDLLVAGRAGQTTIHDCGFPIARHVSLFPASVSAVRLDDVIGDAMPLKIGGARAVSLHPADAVVHICAHATAHRRTASPTWAIDLVTLLRGQPGLAWERVVSRAREWNVAWAVAPLVSWAARELAMPVPASGQAELDRAARWSGLVPRLRLRGARAAGSARRLGAARA
jgi:hypothetical protein